MAISRTAGCGPAEAVRLYAAIQQNPRAGSPSPPTPVEAADRVEISRQARRALSGQSVPASGGAGDAGAEGAAPGQKTPVRVDYLA